MVDPISTRPAMGARTITRIAAVGGNTAPASDRATEVAAAGTGSLGALTRELAGTPPVDTDRVARIKAAVADGTFPILPTQIADRLIAFKLQWNPDDAS